MRKFALRSLVTVATLAIAVGAIAGPKDAELEIGKKGPAFQLIGTDGEKHALKDFVKKSEATVVVFTCNSCPYSKGYEPVLLEMAKSYTDKPVSFVLINSNSVEVQPKDSYELMVERAKQKKYSFPYLYDETQEVAGAYGAQRTPHVFLLDGKGVLRYRGRIDDDMDRSKVQSHDLMGAIDALLAGEEVPVAATKAFGCTIKWNKTSS